MPTSIMQKNYSHCPLKKRPVFMSKEEAFLKNESDGEMEPENLSTKPQDLSMKSMLKKVRAESPVEEVESPSPLVVIKAEDTLPTPPPSSSPSPSDTKSPLSIPTPTYGALPGIYGYGGAAAVYPGFPYAMPYPADFYSAYHHHQSQAQQHQQQQPSLHHPHLPHHPHHSQISPPRSEPLSPYSASLRDTSASPSASPTHLFRPERHSLSPPPSMVVPAYPAELRLNQNNNIVKSESAFAARGQHRYMPYPLHHPHHHHPHHPHHHHPHPHHHHPLMLPVSDHPSLSPASSHTSFNSYLSSRGRSLSPVSSSAPASPGADSEENNNSLSVSNGNNSALSSSSGCSSILTEKSTSSANTLLKKSESTGGSPGSSAGSSAPRYQCPDCGK
uniref:Uncharacterized protein n=1 Tax=Anopheles dirus TaxID=7168 RepID=A0A182MYZ5_9DIPT